MIIYMHVVLDRSGYSQYCLLRREAVEHFLAALNMQQKSRGPSGTQTQMSQNIWTTLRMTLSLMGRSDLYPHCDNNDIDALSSEFGMTS